MAASGNPVLYVTYIEKQGPFIKIWGQPDKSSPVIVKKSLLQMASQFEQGHFIPTLENIHVGNVLYCAKYVDNAYYRVRITNVVMQQNLAEVHFVDFGNREIISITNLRMIPNFAPGLLTIIPQAKDFILANVTHHGSAWDANTFSLISNEIRFSELTYSVLSQFGNCILIKLFKNLEDFALSLFNRGIVLSIALTAQHMILQNTVASGVSPSQITPVSVIERTSPPVAASPRLTQVSAAALSTPPPALLTYKGAIIEPGSEYDVYVSYVCDGPCQFSIQLKKSEDNLARLMKELNSMTLQPLDDFPMPGTVCVARCVEDDHICRAVVTNMVDSQYKVFYVDFGNTEVVPIDNLFQIPFKYVIPKVMATRYALAGLDKGSVTLEMKCAFKEFVCDNLLRMHALAAPARSALPLCSLFDKDGVNVLDVLQRVALVAYPETTQLIRGFSQEVHVSYVHSCSRFFVQMKGKEQELVKLMDNLQAVCANGQRLSNVNVGLPCCALFEDDGQWYRAQIINIEGDNVSVRYVDFGNESIVNVDFLVKPPGEIVTALRPQAVECCLNGYQNMEDDLERDTIFEELILEKDFTIKVVEMPGNRALVDVIDASRYNVGSLLLERLAASKSQVSPILVHENHQIEQRKKRSIDESPNFKNERKPLRDQNDRGFDRQDSWRQPKPPRKDDDFDNIRGDSVEKSWRENNGNARTDTFDKPRSDNFEKRHDSWGDDKSNSTWKSNQRDGFKKDNSQDDKNSNWKSNRRDGFKRDNGEGGDSNTNWKSNNRDGFKKNNWEQQDGESNWKSKAKDDSGWDNSEKSQRPNRFNNDGRKPRDQKPFFGGKKDSWDSSETKNTTNNKVTDPAPFSSMFSIPDVLNRNEKVVISWFHDPGHFFCQLFDSQGEFKTMMEDIQSHYCNIKPETAPVGSSVIALFPEDKIMYRARILETMGSQYRVQYIDFGNVSTTDKVWPVENKFMKLSAQAICCGLNGIIPIDKTWSDTTSFSSYFNKEYFYCQFFSSDNENYAVELTSDSSISVSDALVAAGLAQYTMQQEIYDPSILLGQQIKVTVRDVPALDSFTVELPNAQLLLCAMHNLATSTKTFEDALKQLTENFVLMYVDNVLVDKLEVTLYDTTGTKLQIIEPDEGAFETVDVPCPLPVLYSTINGCVSHFEIEDDVPNIYIQPAEYADALALLLENLFNHYEGAVVEEPVQPEIGGIYAVHSSDTNWYRGQVINVLDESVFMKFIDYGNSETVAKEALQTLGSVFLEEHLLALQVSSAGANETFIEQNVTGTIWYGTNGWEAEIQIQMDSAEQPVVIESDEKVVIEELAIEQPLQEEALLSNQTEAEPLPNIGVLVILSHTDSPNEFYLQQSDSLGIIDNLQTTLQEQVVAFENLESPAIGVLCAAPYSLDQQWYRAQVLDADEDITTVRFVDFGNTDVITNDTTSVKMLPSELLSLEQYARRSSLMVEPKGSEWSSMAFERFEHLTNSEPLTVEIIHQDDKTTFVRLYANGIDVAEILMQEGLANKIQLEIESSCTGYVSNLNSPSEFWIQLENSVADLEWIAEQLSSANRFPELDDLTPGSLCAALFPDDEMWYRARILSNTVAGVEVLFIDYGNSCTCLSLRQLPEDLIMLSPLAQKCSLQKPTGILQWGHQAVEEFKTLSADGATIFNIDKVSTGETYIVSLLLNGEDISKKLLPITEDSYISHFESITNFWIQKTNDISRLNLITEQLTDANNWLSCAENHDSCEFVAALYSEDETWYRARIVSKSDCDFEVFFIDYGNSGRATDVRLLNSDINTECPIATNCRLEPLPNSRWSEDSSNTLAEINNEGSTLFQVEFVGGDLVRLYVDGCDIRSKLESVSISSAQNTPIKSVHIKSINETYKKETSESVLVAESILSEIKNSVNEAIAKEYVEPVTSEDYSEDAIDASKAENRCDGEINSKVEFATTETICSNTEISNSNEVTSVIIDKDTVIESSNEIDADISKEIADNLKLNDSALSCEEQKENHENDIRVDGVENQCESSSIPELNKVEARLNHEDASSDDNNLGTVSKSRCSLPYTEKIVPGSISRGDMSPVENESTFKENCELSKEQGKTKTNEHIVSDVSEQVVDQSCESKIPNEHTFI